MGRVVVGILELQLRLQGCYSLKDKRRILRSVVARAIRLFHVSMAEVADQDLWNVATLGAAVVSNNAQHVESILQKVIDLVDDSPEVEIESAHQRLE